MTRTNRILSFGVYLYIALPFIIFSAGFLKLPLAIIFSLIIAASLVFSTRANERDFVLPFKKGDAIKIAGALLFITGIVLLSGIGNVLWQNNDHATRNTIFDILVNQPWPPVNNSGGEETGLVYYIGFWLPSALFGKIFSLEAGYVFQIVWSVAGLFILWYLLCVVHKKIVFYPLVIFMLFSGWDAVGHFVVSGAFSSLSKLQIGTWAFSQGSAFTTHLEWWARFFQYSSHTTQLFWVFNQCLPVWIATVLILLEKNNKNLVFIMGLTLLSSSLPFVGLIPIFVYVAITNHNSEDLLSRTITPAPLKSFLSLFTFQNLLGGGVSGIVTFLYLKSNIASGTTASQGTVAKEETVFFSIPVFLCVLLVGGAIFLLLRSSVKSSVCYIYLAPILPLAFLMATLSSYKIPYYLLFVILEIVVLAIPSFKRYSDSSLYAVTLCSLLIVPFFIVGKSIDFCMRASIPLLVVMCLFTTVSLADYVKKKQTLSIVLALVILFIGSITSFHEIFRTVEATAYEIQTKGQVENDSKKVETVFKGKNFTGKTKDNFFFEVMAK